MEQLHVGDKVIYHGIVSCTTDGICMPIRVGNHWFDVNELELFAPAAPIVPPGWTPASEPPYMGSMLDKLREVRVMLKDGSIAEGWYGGGKPGFWRVWTGNCIDEMADNAVAWRELDAPVAPAEPEPKEWTVGELKEFIDHGIYLGQDVNIQMDNCNTDVKPEPKYHKGDRVWLHECGEVFPATFKQYLLGKMVKIKRDDGVSNHKKGWYTTTDQLEYMSGTEDPRIPNWLRIIAECKEPTDPAVLAECIKEARHFLELP